jgi:hypothetical protein
VASLAMGQGSAVSRGKALLTKFVPGLSNKIGGDRIEGLVTGQLFNPLSGLGADKKGNIFQHLFSFSCPAKYVG